MNNNHKCQSIKNLILKYKNFKKIIVNNKYNLKCQEKHSSPFTFFFNPLKNKDTLLLHKSHRALFISTGKK